MPLHDVTFREPMRCGGIEGNINPSNVQVPGDILPKICQLQRRASRIGEALALLVAVPAQIQHKSPNWICGIHAVAEQSIPVWIALDGLVLAESYSGLGEELLG